jgi:hypothetical protein
VLVAMTGGHGEWFAQEFAADGGTISPLASLTPEQAALSETRLVVGSQAEALVARRGSGEAVPLWPDARELARLAPHALVADLTPLYGRAPDAKLPGAGQLVACP